MSRAVRVAAIPAVLAASLLAGGCESTQTKSARIGKEAAAVILKAQQPVTIQKASRTVKVKQAVVLTDGGRSAVALQIKVGGGKPQGDVPVLFTVKGKNGRKQFSNDIAGLQPSLQSLASGAPGTPIWWVNDQLLGAQDPTAVTAEVGEGKVLASAPTVDVKDTDFHDDPDGVYYEGTLVNRTGKDLTDVPVYGVGLRGKRVVAAGRALVPRLLAKAGPKPTRFRIFFVGDPRGTNVQVTVAPPVLSKPKATTP